MSQVSPQENENPDTILDEIIIDFWRQKGYRKDAQTVKLIANNFAGISKTRVRRAMERYQSAPPAKVPT